ncbi:hypothetical protein PtB15_3B778 [Puccinia triticina]|nr:hypothetical protein PtB15_3B778 [Puccinia triticina]
MNQFIIVLLWTINCYAMDEPRMNPAAFRNTGPPTFTRERAPSTSPRLLQEHPSNNLNGWEPNRQAFQVNPSIYLSPRPCQMDLEALRPARVDDSVKYYRPDIGPNGNSEEEGVSFRLRECPLVLSRPIEYQDLASKSSRILSPQDKMKRKNSDPPDNNDSPSVQRSRNFSKLRGALIEPEEHEPGSSSTGDNNCIIRRLPPNFSSSPTLMSTSSKLLNTATNQEWILAREGISDSSTTHRLPPSTPHQFTMNNPHHIPINNQGLASTHSRIVTNSGSKGQIPGHEEDQIGHLLVFDKTVFGYSTANIFQQKQKNNKLRGI